MNLYEINRNYVKEIVLIRNSKTIRNKCSARGKVSNSKLKLSQERAQLKTFRQAYGKNKQVLIKKPCELRHLKRVIARTRDLRIIILRNKYWIAC